MVVGFFDSILLSSQENPSGNARHSLNEEPQRQMGKTVASICTWEGSTNLVIISIRSCLSDAIDQDVV